MTIEVSSGVAAKAKYPTWSGCRGQPRATTLEAAGFVVEVVQKHVSDKNNVGIVLDQIPSRRYQAAARARR